MIPQDKINEMVNRICPRYEELFIKEFWKWVNFPENADKRDMLIQNEKFVSSVLKLAWMVISASPARHLLDAQQVEFMKGLGEDVEFTGTN